MEPSPRFFKQFNRVMVTGWRLGLGRLVNSTPSYGGRIMVLGTVGRKSGVLRRTPLNYHRRGDTVFCLAGFGHRTDWLRNLKAIPHGEVWLPDGRWQAEASVMEEGPTRLLRLRQVLVDSGFAAHVFGGINPRQITDEQLEEFARGYEVVQLKLAAPVPGSAADLAWLWPVAGGVLLAGLWWMWKQGYCCGDTVESSGDGARSPAS